MDFVSDALADGRRFRSFTLEDDATRECRAIEAERPLQTERVIAALDRVGRVRTYPDTIVWDNGPEFQSKALDQCSNQHGIS